MKWAARLVVTEGGVKEAVDAFAKEHGLTLSLQAPIKEWGEPARLPNGSVITREMVQSQPEMIKCPGHPGKIEWILSPKPR